MILGLVYLVPKMPKFQKNWTHFINYNIVFPFFQVETQIQKLGSKLLLGLLQSLQNGNTKTHK